MKHTYKFGTAEWMSDICKKSHLHTEYIIMAVIKAYDLASTVQPVLCRLGDATSILFRHILHTFCTYNFHTFSAYYGFCQGGPRVVTPIADDCMSCSVPMWCSPLWQFHFVSFRRIISHPRLECMPKEISIFSCTFQHLLYVSCSIIIMIIT